MHNNSNKNVPCLQFDDFVAGIVPMQGGPDIPLADNSTTHNIALIDNADSFVSLADFFASQGSVSTFNHFVFSDGSGSATGDKASQPTTAQDNDSVSNSDEVHASELPPVAPSNTDTSTDSSGVSFGVNSEGQLSGNDHTDNQLSVVALDAKGITDLFASFTDAPTPPSGHFFEATGSSPAGIADVVSDALGHGGGGPGGGGGGGGGTVPSPYTTNSGTGVDVHVTFDNSVANAPSGFVSTIEKVADFFANSLQDATAITINIAVGFGEVDGMKLGIGATGESVTNLQPVSYSDLANAYSATGLSLGNSVPNGNLYVPYAEAKALNIAITDPQAVDGWVGFSSKSGIFDYNNADGVSSKQYDFYGVVAHEFSEVLGRILLVGGSISGAASYSAYDLFHFSSPGVQDFSGNGGYFSIDQGTTNLASFNNPTFGGDPGDWASTGTSNSGGSAHDAFNAFDTAGVVTPVSHTDLVALQSLGYTLNSHLV